MAGIYVHIPFCKQACTYCDFHFSTVKKNIPGVMEAISRELEMRAGREEFPNASTLYFGGGTPSIVPAESIAGIIGSVRKLYGLLPNAEITLEANPDDIRPDTVAAWKEAGVNRLSIGIQSFRDHYLKWMNRSHDAEQAVRATSLAVESGITNVSIDLIYGLPDLSIENWEKELDIAVGLGASHVSAYCLTVEPRTALGHMVKNGGAKPVDEDAAADQFALMVTRLAAAGYRQYEVSNFALPGRESKHNASYWKGEPYLGIGPAAHGFVRGNRYWNVANNARYMQSIEKGELPQTIEHLTETDQYNEWVMTGMRTSEGIGFEDARRLHGVDLHERFAPEISKLMQANLGVMDDDRLKLTTRGLFLADGIAADFFL